MSASENPTLEELLTGGESALLSIGQRVHDLICSELVCRAFEKTPFARTHNPSRTFGVQDKHNPGHPASSEPYDLDVTSTEGQSITFVIQTLDHHLQTIKGAVIGVFKKVPAPGGKKEDLTEIEKRLFFDIQVQLQELRAQIDSNPELQRSLQKEIDETTYY